MPTMHPHIIALARDWLGTPYHHQASLRGVGTDCVGLIRGIYRELLRQRGRSNACLHPRLGGRQRPRDAHRSRAPSPRSRSPRFDAKPGDVLVFRWRAPLSREALRHPVRSPPP